MCLEECKYEDLPTAAACVRTCKHDVVLSLWTWRLMEKSRQRQSQAQQLPYVLNGGISAGLKRRCIRIEIFAAASGRCGSSKQRKPEEKRRSPCCQRSESLRLKTSVSTSLLMHECVRRGWRSTECSSRSMAR